MARRVSFGASFLAAALLVAACGGSGGAGSDGGGQGTVSAETSGGGGSGTNGGGGSGTNGGGGSGTNGGGGSGTSGGGGDNGFAYTPWGPDDPPIPDQYAAFATASSEDLNCQSVSDLRSEAEFWAVAADVCNALKENKDWPDTTSVPAPPKADNAYQECLNGELAAMLDRALRWHAANPGRTPVIRYPRRSSTSPCQSRIYSVEVLPESDPDSSAGKLAVAVTAPTSKNNGDFSVTVDGQPSDQDDVIREDAGDGLQRAVVLLDPPTHDRDATVVVDNGRGKMTAGIRLTAGNGSGSPSGSGVSGSPGGDNATPGQSDGQPPSGTTSPND